MHTDIKNDVPARPLPVMTVGRLRLRLALGEWAFVFVGGHARFGQGLDLSASRLRGPRE